MNRHDGREAGAQLALKRMVGIEHDLYRDSLDDFGEVSGCVVRRQKRKLRSTGGRDFRHFSVQHDPGKGIDGDVGDIPGLHVGKLGLFVVGLDPDIASDQIDHLHAGSDQLPLLHMTLADSTIGGGDDARVSEIDVRRR